MKKIYFLAVFFFSLTVTNLTAQTAYATWPLTSDQNPNTLVGNIQAQPQFIGTPTSPYKLEMYPQEPYSNSNRGQQLWTGNQGTGWIAGLPDYTRYIQFDASPTSGNDFTVQFISFDYSDFPTPNNSDFHILKSEVWYAIDNNWSSSVQLINSNPSNPLDYLSSAIQTFSASINVQVQDGQTFSVRIYPYAPNGAIAMTPSFATHRNVIIEGNTEVSSTVESVCTDFEDGLANGWQTSNAGLTIIQDGENQYLQTTDQSGSSTFFYDSGSLIGDWSSYLENGCGSLCWDVNYLYAGVGNDGSSQPITITPTIRIEGNGFAAYFLTNSIITAGDGWHSYCAPLKLINNGDPLPSNSEGQWIMITGTNSDWNSMLSNISLLRFSIDPTSYQSERFGFDNICLNNTGDCDPVVQLGSICGMKFNDLDGDGEKDDNELGLSGWTINLSMGAVNMTAETGEDGSYCFNDLQAGTYTLWETPQDDWTQTYPMNPSTYTVELSAGENILDIDFGNTQVGSICGMKFNDLDGDGEKDVNELGLSGWTINLSMGAVEMSATTGEDGNYCFNDLQAGTYILYETPPQDGWVQTYPANPYNHTIILADGENVDNIDFGNHWPVGSICGMKFNDLDGDGEKDDNEPVLSGWIIELTYWDVNGVNTLRDTTDSNGEYCFNNLPLAYYTVKEVNKPEWIQTLPDSGSYTITINQEVNLIGYDFGNKEVLNPDCTDFENNSLNGWQANNISTSFQQEGNNHYIQTTDQAGVSTFYTTNKPYTGNWTSLFSNGCGSLCFDINFIYGGNVYQGQTPPQTLTPYIALEGNGFAAAFIANQQISVGDGWHTFCAPLSFLNSDGTLPSNSDGYWIMTTGTPNDWNTLLTNVTKVRLLADPTSFQGEKIGYDNICLKDTGDCNSPLQLGSICGLKILDKDGDGERDSNEDIIPNWNIFLTDGNLFYTAVTDENGEYCFNDLPAGTYTVSEEHRTGYRQIFPPDPGVHTFTLLPGENKTNINFSNIEDITVQLGSICGIKFNDINGDGDQDLPNEVGLAGWTFELTGASNQSVVTDLNGNFCFTNLPVGTYTLKEIIQDGWEPTTPNTLGIINVTLAEGENREGIFFGNKEIFGSICGMKYNDLNDNGEWDQGEPSLSGWQITLSLWGHTASGHASGPTLDEIGVDTTDENGNYCFTNVRQGNYLVGEIAQDGWTQTEPSSFVYGLTIAPGENIEGLNFGNKEDSSVVLGSICGIKFNDKDGDGEKDDGELGIPDWQIQIGGPIDMTVVTDKEGKFCFENLPPGEYKVGEVMQSRWRQTLPSTNFYIIQLASGENITDLLFGNTEDDSVQLGSICGTKFNDKNRDGRKVSGEPGINGWTIYLEGPMNLTAITDANGDFCFYGLIPGTYTVREENNTGWRQTKPSSITYTLEVGNGDNFDGIDFGNAEDPTVTYGSICGMKFNDLNGDGEKQDNEPGIPNWTINLSGTINLTATTDSRGKFCFENLIFGRYTLYESRRDGWVQTAPSTGSFAFELSEDNSNPDTFYFGNKEDINVRLGSICGMKYFDKDGDGTKDLTEPGIADWQINISGPIDRSIITDKNGEFCFDELPPGTYTIKEEPKTDWVQTDPTSPNSYTVVLTSGQNLTGYYFGNKYEPEIGCVDPPNGMVAWWSLDLSARDLRQDYAGYNNSGTMMNSPLQVAGKVLGALQFDGVDDYVEVEDHAELNFGTGDFSFDAWIKTDIVTGVEVIIDKRKGYSLGYSFFLNDGYLSLQLSDGSFPFGYTNYASPVFVADGNWHHIAVTVSRSNSQGILFYLDGVSTQFGNPTAHPATLTNTDNLRIGKNSASTISDPIGTFNGILDEIELFNRVLTPDEIQTIYNAGSAGKCKPDDQGGSVSGTVWYDFNHNGVMDPNEDGLARWPVLLNGPTIAQTETDDYGYYVFTGCKPGDYTISVVKPNDWSCTYPLGGQHFIRSRMSANEASTVGNLHFGLANDPCPTGQKTWYPLGSGVNGNVFALAADGNNLFVGGFFTIAGGVNVNNLAMWNGSNWSDIGGGVNGPVYALKVVGNKLYVGGLFNLAGNVNVKNIAMWDGAWHALGDGTNGVVSAMEVIGPDLFVGGSFTTAGIVNASCIAKWNITSSFWMSLGGGVTPQSQYVHKGVLSLIKNGTDLIVGGRFWGTGGASGALNLVKLNITNSSWSPIGNVPSLGLENKPIWALSILNGELYAGGEFLVAGSWGNLVNHITQWDNVNSVWQPLGTGMNGSYVLALKTDGTNLYAGGSFLTANGISVKNIAYWNGTNWIALGAGISGNFYTTVFAVELKNDGLYVGGRFSSAGNISANNIARYSCSGTPTSVGDDNTINVMPQQFQISQNYPNPFNPTTTIRYDLPNAGFVKITIYDILGREVKVLVNEEKNPGVYEVKFDGKNLASGIYFYTIRTANFTQSKKMILLK